MYHFIFPSIALLLFILIRFLGKRWNFGYIIGGIIYGIYNEVCFEFCWDYSPLLSPMIWRDIPLFVVLGWGLVAGMALVLSDRTAQLFHWKKSFVLLLFDVILFSAMGYCVESIMSTLNFWKYNIPFLAVLWVQIMGYVFVGILVSTTGRTLQKVFDGYKNRPSVSGNR